MPNSFAKRSAEELSLDAQTLLAQIPAPPAPNGLDMTAAQRANLESVTDRITAAIQAQKTAEQALRQATIEKGFARNAVVYQMNAIAKAAYVNGISDETLAGFGFAPQRTPPVRPAMPIPVTGLAAEPSVDGTVRLSWDRSGNRSSTSFIVERSADGASWSQVGSTLATRATLGGFDPGMTAWFRIVATNSVGTALPSTPTSIYAPLAPTAPALRVA